MSDKISILIIDDKRIIGDLFDFTLGYSGHVVTVVDNAQAAIDAVKEQPFDIVFLDIVMPEKDGVETLKDIKQIAPNLPVVMMSGYSVEEKKKKAKEYGAVTCLRKPFEIDEVKVVIKSVLGKDI